MLCDIELKKVEVKYSFYFTLIRLGCPFCENNVPHKTKTFKSLKQITWHLAHFHSEPSMRYPFTMEEVQQVLMVIAKAKEWRILK